MIKIIKKDVLSSDKLHMLRGKIYIPDKPAKGLFQIVHGMNEHIGRYDGFMRLLAREGYIAFGYDQLGHGKTASNESELGYFAAHDGWQRLIDDAFIYGNAIRKAMGGELPFILMGYSMGSFVVRLCAAKYNRCDRLIVMSSGGANPLSGMGIMLARVIKKLRGDRHISKLMYQTAFRSYNKRFISENDPLSWVSSDKENRESFRTDRLSAFRFSISAMEDLIRLYKYCNDKSWYRAVDKSKPILLLSGAEDPVGDYGAGIMKVYDRLLSAGANARIKLYDGCRHEILREPCRDEVIGDILRFIGEG